jgi:triosephosphate isomerase
MFLPSVNDVEGREIVIAPSFTLLDVALECVADSDVVIAAQNMFYEKNGAFTGEVSPEMLVDAGVEMVILGHSERRHIFGEGDDVIARKVNAAFSWDIRPILCVGETLEERDDNRLEEVLERQLSSALVGLDSENMRNMIIAYEPVWAIGTGRTAGPDQAQEAHQIIRAWIEKHFETGIAELVRLLYGGSVKPDNIEKLMDMPDVDGVLVGGAALEPASFASIVNCKISIS